MARIKLKKCPFCGGDAEIRKAFILLTEARIVRCSTCLCKTTSIPIDHPKMAGGGKLDESTRYTAEQAEAKAAELWNNRATVYQ